MTMTSDPTGITNLVRCLHCDSPTDGAGRCLNGNCRWHGHSPSWAVHHQPWGDLQRWSRRGLRLIVDTLNQPMRLIDVLILVAPWIAVLIWTRP